jgi:hypothetical protein
MSNEQLAMSNVSMRKLLMRGIKRKEKKEK